MHLGKIAAGVLLATGIASTSQAGVMSTIAIGQTGATTGPSPLSVGQTYGLTLSFVAGSGTGGFASNPAAAITITDPLKLVAGDTFAFTSIFGSFVGQVLGGADAPTLKVAQITQARTVSAFILGTFTSLLPGVGSGDADFTVSLTQSGRGTGAISVSATLDPPLPLPEPISLSLMGLGLLGLGAARRLR